MCLQCLYSVFIRCMSLDFQSARDYDRKIQIFKSSDPKLNDNNLRPTNTFDKTSGHVVDLKRLNLKIIMLL